jgi:hypothetical protein
MLRRNGVHRQAGILRTFPIVPCLLCLAKPVIALVFCDRRGSNGSGVALVAPESAGSNDQARGDEQEDAA